MLANDDYRQSGLFNEERKEIIFSHIPSPYETIKIQCNANYKNGLYGHEINKMVTVKKINDMSGCVSIEDNNGTKYKGDESVGKTLFVKYFNSHHSDDSMEYTVQSSPLLSPYQSYSGITDGYWKDLQPKSKKCLILKMEAGNFIRNSGKNGEELNSNVVNEEFLILDGIDYKSNNADHALIYMVI